MEGKQGSIKKQLFYFTFSFVCVMLVVYALTSLWTVNRLSNHSFLQRSSFEQILFADSIKNDVMIGPYSEVGRKCEQLYHSGHISSVYVENSRGKVLCALPESTDFVRQPDTMETRFFTDSEHKKLAGVVSVNYVNSSFGSILNSALWNLLLVVLITVPLLSYAIRWMADYLAGPVARLSEIVLCKDLREMINSLKNMPTRSQDVAVLHAAIGQMTEKLFEGEQQKMELAKFEGMTQIASQVAHDIRSPIMALSLAVKNIVNLPEQDRILIRSATQQITDITNNMLIQRRTVDLGEGVAPQNATPELLFALMENLVSTKRAQYCEALQREELDIQFDVEDGAYGLFVNIFSVEFNRVLSNLINNAVEAMQEKGVVNIHLNSLPSQNAVQIQIKDSGCGMSGELIAKVMKGGVSVGKKGGHGMGLASSKVKVESWGGTFDLSSVPDQGTTITLELNTTPAPEWFRTRVPVPTEGTLVVLDDDPTIHNVWDIRFANFFPEKTQVQLLHFDDAETFLNYEHAALDSVHYLVDYELLGSQISGLDAIEKLDIADLATLVTSRYEDPLVRARCVKLGCKILPKSYAPHAPLVIMPKKPDLVLIDDNTLMTMSWEMTAERMNHQIITFTTSADARNVIPFLPRETPIYVDSSLSDNEKGEDFAKELYDIGFKYLFLATGFEPDSFGDLPWIKAIVGKDYPEDLPLAGEGTA